MSQNNSDAIKQSVDFLRTDNSYQNDYTLVKSGKSILNLKKEQFYNINHNQVENYFINCKNNYAEYPFNGSSGFFVDFDVPKGVQNTVNQFVLRFTLQNKGSAVCGLLPSPLIIEKVSLLKNSNSLGLDITDWQIYLYNLNKYYSNKNKEDTYVNLNVGEVGPNKTLACPSISNVIGSPDNIFANNIELPISLNRSEFPLFLMKDNLTIRIYFKPNIVYENITNSQVRFSDVGLVLRCHSLNNNELNKIVKQPKFNHMFNKMVHLKFSLPKLDIGIEQSVPLSGFRNVCGGMLMFFQNPENNITLAYNFVPYHYLVDRFDQVYITDPTGRNINNNLKQDYKWNQYLMSNHFGKSNDFLNALCYNTSLVSDYGKNQGQLYYLGFSQDGSDSFTGVYSGGYHFGNVSGDHILKFTPSTSHPTNLVLNILAFVPAILSLEGGDVNEMLA